MDKLQSECARDLGIGSQGGGGAFFRHAPMEENRWIDTTTLFAKIDPFFAAAQLQTPMIDRLYARRTETLFRT